MADEFEVGFYGSGQSLRGQLLSCSLDRGLPVHHGKAKPFSHSFLLQWENFIRFIKGQETLLVPGEEAARSITFIERCYAERTFMEPPWFTEEEKKRGRELNAKVIV